MRHATGPGRSEKRTQPPSTLLYNFDIDGDRLKREHQQALREVVAQLETGGSVSIVGLASRSGSAAHNEQLSTARAKNTLSHLRGAVRHSFNARVVLGLGERQAQREGYRDRSEDERFRSVVIFVSPGPVPPAPSLPAGFLQREVPVIQEPGALLDTVGEVLDVVNGIASLEVFLTGVLAEIFSVTGILTTAMGPFLAILAAWKGGDDLARRNGLIRGYSEGIAKMANAFRDQTLARRPESQWPPIPRPRFRTGAEAEHPLTDDAVRYEDLLTRAQKITRKAIEQGYELAYTDMIERDKKPRPSQLIIGGRKVGVALSGRGLLFLLHRAYGDNVKEKIQQTLGFRYK